MKKSILVLTICIVSSISLCGQEHGFEYITEDIFFHKPFILEPSPYDHFFTSKDGSSKLHYEGWIDSTGTPRCFGKIVEGMNNTLLSGQIKDGQFDGWCSSREIGFDGIMKWQDSSQTVVPVGWGRSSIPFVYIADQSKSDGLALIDNAGNTNGTYYLSSGELLWAHDAYSKILYENQKSNIKKICTKKELKYVEDVNVGNAFIYTGGWKDGAPYSYGAYFNRSMVFCGYFKYNPNNITFEANNKGSWTEFYSVSPQYNPHLAGCWTNHPFVLRQHTIKSTEDENGKSKQYVEDIELNMGKRTKAISDAKGNVLEFEAFYFNDGQYLFGKRENSNGPFWGCIVGKDDFYEGYIGSKRGSLMSMGNNDQYGKIIHVDGHLLDNTIGDGKKILKFAAGDVLWIEKDLGNGLFLGDYTYSNGSYVVGVFECPRDIWDQQAYVPIYAESYDKDNIIIKSYVETQRLGKYKATEIEKEITRLKKEHRIPLHGRGTMAGDNYTYEGEFSARRFNGKGRLLKNDGTYYDGLWKRGVFMTGECYIIYNDGTSFKGMYERSHAKEGTFTTSDGTKVTRTWKVDGSSPNDHVDIIYPNGSEYHGPCITIGSDQNKREYSLVGDSVVIVDSIGNRYVGGWNLMGRVGNGVEVFANGDLLNTVWENDVFVQDAAFTYTWSDGRKFVGVAGKNGKIGKGVYYKSDGLEASKKEYKDWMTQMPTTMNLHENPVKRNIP